MFVPFNDLKIQYTKIRSETNKAIQRVLDSSSFILGKEGEAFEKEFARYCGTKYAVGVASGTEAIYLALWSVGVGAGHEVITVTNAGVPPVAAIRMTGAKPIFVDVNEYDFDINPSLIEKAITKRTKVIMPVHLYGQPANMKEIIQIAKENSLLVVEDASQAHGASYSGKRIGSIGDIGCFSFYPTKNLAAYGDGGIVVTNSKDFYEKLKLLRNYGQKNRYYNVVEGINSRLDEIQAAILRVKLKYLNKLNKERRKIAFNYSESLENVILCPKEINGRYHVFHLYVIRSKKRKSLINHLNRKGIQTLVHYPIPVHLQEAYSFLGLKRGSLDVSEKLAREVLSLPLYPGLSLEKIEFVCDTIKSFEK